MRLKHDESDRQGLTAALVISLDFELHWGVRDVHPAAGEYSRHLLGARDAIPRLLELFVAFRISATWATVGFLFAESRDELHSFRPAILPHYHDERLNPYQERVGHGEADDPLHYAPSLVRLIADTPRQEIGTHTYSHYYCLAPGSDANSFAQDLGSAQAIAAARGIELRSIVFPRNQWNPRFASALASSGIQAYRGLQPGWMYCPDVQPRRAPVKRAGRLLDAHLRLTSWRGAAQNGGIRAEGPVNVPAGAFLRPVTGRRWGDRARTNRIKRALTEAARGGRMFHLWWHPHNFGVRTTENLDVLRELLCHVEELRGTYGMRSLSMIDAAQQAVAKSPPPRPLPYG